VTSLAEESQQEAGKIGTMVDEITADSEERPRAWRASTTPSTGSPTTSPPS
jgi:methyl-accepting chemotaxis protein